MGKKLAQIKMQSRQQLAAQPDVSGSYALTTVSDVADDLQLVSNQPEQMQAAQGQLAEWFQQKQQIAATDVEDAQLNLSIAEQNQWETASFKRQLRAAAGRLRFYEKCLLAVEAGYCIVPNFPIDVFAIRTTRKRPPKASRESEWHRSWFVPVESDSPAAGEGEWRPAALALQRTDEERQGKDGKTKVVHCFESPNEWGEVEFPVSIAQPLVMQSTAEAMALSIFDEVGCLPARRKGDPLVIGQIYTNRQQSNWVSFLIAWWIDTRQLP